VFGLSLTSQIITKKNRSKLNIRLQYDSNLKQLRIFFNSKNNPKNRENLERKITTKNRCLIFFLKILQHTKIFAQQLWSDKTAEIKGITTSDGRGRNAHEGRKDLLMVDTADDAAAGVAWGPVGPLACPENQIKIARSQPKIGELNQNEKNLRIRDDHYYAIRKIRNLHSSSDTKNNMRA